MPPCNCTFVQISMFDMNLRPGKKNPGRGYRFYTGQSVLYPFGHGLSYAKYNCTILGRVGNSVSVQINRTSGMEGTVAFMVYYKPLNAGMILGLNMN